jgi:hypothetical protein
MTNVFNVGGFAEGSLYLVLYMHPASMR